MNASLATVRCGEYHVVVWMHTAVDPSPEDWETAIKKVHALVRTLNGDLSKIRTLAISDGGAPNTLQRAEYADLTGGAKAAAVTTVLMNPLKRGILTALTWLNPNFRAYPPDRFKLAFEHLELAKYQSLLLSEMKKVDSLLKPPLQTLALMLVASDG